MSDKYKEQFPELTQYAINGFESGMEETESMGYYWHEDAQAVIDKLQAELKKWKDPLSYISAESHNKIVDKLQAELKQQAEEIRRLENETTDLNNTIGFMQTGLDEWKAKADKQAEEIEQYKSNQELYGSCLRIMSNLKALYEYFPDCKSEPPKTACQTLIKECEEGLRNGRARQMEKIIRQQAEEIAIWNTIACPSCRNDFDKQKGEIE